MFENDFVFVYLAWNFFFMRKIDDLVVNVFCGAQL